MGDSLLDAARKWLAKSGYPLELRVGRVLRARGWDVQHARPFLDPRENKIRELDLLTTKRYSNTDSSVMVDVALAIECKSTSDPWIVISSPPGTDLSTHDGTVSDNLSRSILFIAMLKSVARPRILIAPKSLSHGVVRAHKKDATGDPTHPFAAVNSVLTACSAIGRGRSAQLVESGEAIQWIAAMTPLIVLDGPLLEYSIGDDDTESLRDVEFAAVVSPSPVDGFTSIVRVVTWKAWPDFVDGHADGLDAFGNGMVLYARDVFAMERGRTIAH